MKHTTTISGDLGSIKELLSKLDPVAGAKFNYNCYCASHGAYTFMLEWELDINNNALINKVDHYQDLGKGLIINRLDGK